MRVQLLKNRGVNVEDPLALRANQTIMLAQIGVEAGGTGLLKPANQPKLG